MHETFLKIKNATLNDDKISFVSKFMLSLFLNGHRQKCEMILYDRPEE